MAVYTLIFLFLILCTVISIGKSHSKIEDLLFWICALLFVVLSAVRDFSVGADTVNYCRGYSYIRRLAFLQAVLDWGWEPGYVAINWLLGFYFENERALLVFMSVFTLWPVFCWMKKESEAPIFSLIVFFSIGIWHSSMNILREFCAIAILTYSYNYIRERKLIKFLLVVLIAMLFHRTAAIFILAYIIENIDLNKDIIILSMPFSALLGIGGNRIMNILNRYARIAEAKEFNGGITMLILLWFCVIAVLVSFRDFRTTKVNFSFRLIYLAAFLQPISFTFSLWSRVVFYFTISLTVFLPNCISEFTKEGTRNQKLRVPLYFILFVLIFVWFKISNYEPYFFMQ